MRHGHLLRLTLALLALALPAAAQRSRIPIEQGSSGDPGMLCWKDSAGAEQCWSIPSGATGAADWVLPVEDIDGGGCFLTDGDGVVTVGSCGAGGGSLPVVDSTSLVQGSSDNTKQVRLEVDDFLTTGTTRVLSVQDANYVLAGTNIGNLWSDDQYYSNNKWLLWADSVGTYIPILRLDSNDHLQVQTVDSTATVRKALWTDDQDRLHVGLDGAGAPVGNGAIVLHTKTTSMELPNSLTTPGANSFLRFDAGGKATWTQMTVSPTGTTVVGSTREVTGSGCLGGGGPLSTTVVITSGNCVSMNTTQTITGQKSFAALTTFGGAAAGTLGSAVWSDDLGIAGVALEVLNPFGSFTHGRVTVSNNLGAVATIITPGSVLIDPLSSSAAEFTSTGLYGEASAWSFSASGIVQDSLTVLDTNQNLAVAGMTGENLTLAKSGAPNPFLTFNDGDVTGSVTFTSDNATGAEGVQVSANTGSGVYPAVGGVLKFGLASRHWAEIHSDSYYGASGSAGASSALACGSGQAVKNITVSGGIVTAVSCGAP